MKLWFDGSARPNPGAVVTAVVVHGQTHIRNDWEAGDNNDAEWRALLHALSIARQLGLREATLLGDSALVISQASGTAPCRDERFRHYLAAYNEAAAHLGKIRIRRIARAQNLAGIALERLHGRL
ncbi:reverse transcriptase-like protein [Novosphingobium sp.]|uniref:reverse transcriptase-like protein n=1 Tax=Novosphingobium sp. TaxID=1874826 RepID=UPI0035B1A440